MYIVVLIKYEGRICAWPNKHFAEKVILQAAGHLRHNTMNSEETTNS